MPAADADNPAENGGMGAIVHMRRPFAVQFEPVRDEPAHLRVEAKVLDVADRLAVAGPPVQPRVPPACGQRPSTGSHGPAGRARQLGQPVALWPSGPAGGATAQRTPSPSELSSSPYTTSTPRRPQAVSHSRFEDRASVRAPTAKSTTRHDRARSLWIRNRVTTPRPLLTFSGTEG